MTKKKQCSSGRRSGEKSQVNHHLALVHKRKITGKQIFSSEDGSISELEDRSWLNSGKHLSCLCTV